MSRTATQLAGDAGSIFQAWLDLKKQTGKASRTSSTRDVRRSDTGQMGRNTSP